jgi:hypothetical protein
MKTAVSAESPFKPTADERRDARERVSLGAQAEFANGAISVECLVTQLSATGARLELPFAIVSLRTLHLSIPERNLKRRARVVWRRVQTMGVKFEDEQPS